MRNFLTFQDSSMKIQVSFGLFTLGYPDLKQRGYLFRFQSLSSSKLRLHYSKLKKLWTRIFLSWLCPAIEESSYPVIQKGYSGQISGSNLISLPSWTSMTPYSQRIYLISLTNHLIAKNHIDCSSSSAKETSESQQIVFSWTKILFDSKSICI